MSYGIRPSSKTPGSAVTNNGGVVISMSRLTRLFLSADESTVYIGVGLNWRKSPDCWGVGPVTGWLPLLPE